MTMSHCLGHKLPICQNENFFRKPVNNSCSFYSCVSTCQMSKSGVDLLKKYWRLKNTEISLAKGVFLIITWESDFSQARSFHRMLMNHKNFRFTPISGKTNDMIFLKSPKTLFLGHFWSFLPDGKFFSKNLAVTRNYIWAPNTMVSFRKNWWANSKKTFGETEGRTAGQTDRPYFIGHFRLWPGG